MSGGLFKVIIEDQDYDHTVYTTWVSVNSQKQAIACGAALAGAEKARREFERTGRGPLADDGRLTMPQIRVEPCSVDEFYAHEYEVLVEDDKTRRASRSS